MDKSTKALTIKSADYNENDKFILLYSPEMGKITVRARGVKKADAKLKFVQEPFCFAEVELAETGGRFTLKTARQMESFFSLREDIVKFYAGCSVLECLANCEEEGQPNPPVFVMTLRALQALDDGKNPLLVTLWFLLGYLQESGYRLDPDKCTVCSKKVVKRAYLDLQFSGICCEDCRSANSYVLTAPALSLLKLIDGLSADKLGNLKVPDAQIKECLTAVAGYISHCLGRIKNVGELVKL